MLGNDTEINGFAVNGQLARFASGLSESDGRQFLMWNRADSVVKTKWTWIGIKVFEERDMKSITYLNCLGTPRKFKRRSRMSL